jgi:hypothetical protein
MFGSNKGGRPGKPFPEETVYKPSGLGDGCNFLADRPALALWLL